MELQEHKRIIEYLPAFLRRYREYRSIFSAAQTELNAIFLKNDHLLANMFTETAEIDGIARREKMYRIFPSASATKEERRLAIRSKETKLFPYTYRQFKEMLAAMCGVDNYKITLAPEGYALNVKVRVTAGTSAQVADALLEAIDELTAQVKPCNLVYSSTLFERHSGTQTTYFGAAVSVMKKYNVEVF